MAYGRKMKRALLSFENSINFFYLENCLMKDYIVHISTYLVELTSNLCKIYNFKVILYCISQIDGKLSNWLSSTLYQTNIFNKIINIQCDYI